MKKEWEVMKGEYEGKLGKLYMAQMRKEAADRATAIALAEVSLSDHNNDSNKYA